METLKMVCWIVWTLVGVLSIIGYFWGCFWFKKIYQPMIQAMYKDVMEDDISEEEV